MERFSWQVHFRNQRKLRRDWHSVPISGTIRVSRSRRFFCLERIWESCVETGLAPSLVDAATDAARDAASRVSTGGQRRIEDSNHALGGSNSALATSGYLQPALPGRAWTRHRTNRDVDIAKETSPRRNNASPEIKTSHQRPRDQQAHVISHLGSKKQKHSRQEGLEEARPAGHRPDSRPPNSDRPHPRALHAGRALRELGQHDPGRDAALSGRSRMAVEDHSRCPSADQTRIRPEPRSPAQPGKCHDRRASGRRSEGWS